MNGYERRTELKKAKIRAAALELFCIYGTDKTSIQEIAQKSGVAPASIYNYFGSKEGLMKEATINLLERGWQARKELWESDLPFPELVKRAVSLSYDFIDHINLETLRVLFNADPEIKKVADDYYKLRYPDIVRNFMEKGRREGYIRQELSLEAATIYLKMYQNLFQQPEILQNPNKDLLKELCDLMFYGLMGQVVMDEKAE